MTAATTKIESLEKLLTTPANVEVEEGSARSSEQAAEVTTQSPPQQATVQPISQQIVQKFGRFKMDQNTWVFNGTKDENIRDWLFQVKDQLDKSDMPSTEWLSYLTNFMNKNYVLPHAQNLQKLYNNKTPWNVFENKMIQLFEHPDYQRKLKSQ